MAHLYDHPVDFYVYACTTNGSFDAEKATALGYNEAQLPVIEQFMAANPDGVKAALENMTAAEPVAEPALVVEPAAITEPLTEEPAEE